jgi:diaminopimelate epimerase
MSKSGSIKINFSKYQGTGNDFILIDDRQGKYNHLLARQIEWLCHRRFGIGADGLILLQSEKGYDFRMKYYNSDGRESTMCGNGGRCIAQFAYDLKLVPAQMCFLALDGPHEASIEQGVVRLKMKDVYQIKQIDDYFILNTGSPHYVRWVKDLTDWDVFTEGRKVRYAEPFREEGINVNFVERINGSIKVRTYERGVENETYSCGTGVVASALVKVYSDFAEEGNYEILVQTKGGELSVQLTREGNAFKDIWLIGPATFVFSGTIELT